MSLNIVSSFNGVSDTDAAAYIEAVEAADGEPLEFAVGNAINNFVLGCKADGIWDAIKASCILAGARTTNGALIPLKGTAPTPVNFDLVNNTDYNRKTGLVGDGSTKYLDGNQNNNTDPQDSRHFGLFVSTADSLGGARQYIGTQDLTGGSVIGRSGTTANLFGSLSNESGAAFTGRGAHTGFIGLVRSNSSSITMRSLSTVSTNTIASQARRSESILVFARPGTPATTHSNARIAFYSIGEALDLQKLDSRVTDLITAIGVAF